MLVPTINGNQEINFANLEALSNQGNMEKRRAGKNRLATQHEKASRLIEERLDQLKVQKKDGWHAALFSFFVGLLAQGIQALDLIVPILGTGLSKALSFLQEINPFIRNKNGN